MTRDEMIAELTSDMQPLCLTFLMNCQAAGIPMTLIDTLRTPAQQQINVANGVSWTLNSKHLPQPPEGKSDAWDAAPTELIGTKLWSPASPLWGRVGIIGTQLGLAWGGDWTHHPDPSHWERKPAPIVTDPEIGMD
jgi:peptidoglycan L-alanyl-D-glutamate endopeptidase CwlK